MSERLARSAVSCARAVASACVLAVVSIRVRADASTRILAVASVRAHEAASKGKLAMATICVLAMASVGVLPIEAAHAQPAFDWSTAVIHRAHELPAVASAEVAASMPLGSFDAIAQDIASGAYLKGTAVSIRLDAGSNDNLSELLAAADGAGLFVVGEVSSDSVDLAVRAAQLGVDALVVPAGDLDIAALRSALAGVLRSGVAIATFAESASIAPGRHDWRDGADALIHDPPVDVPSESGGWDAAFLAAAKTGGITRIRPDLLPPEILHRLLLMPGGIWMEGWGDELARAILAFRARHPAIGAGRHERLVNNADSFHRSLRGTQNDDVVIVLNAEGRTTVNVSRAFEDDTIVRDAVTGRTAFVSFGMASFDPHAGGILLIEAIP